MTTGADITLHVVGVPYTSTTDKYNACPFTMITKRFCSMMTDIGYEVILYGGPENEARVAEHVVVADEEFQHTHYGEHNPQEFFPVNWKVDAPEWVEFRSMCIEAIAERINKRDIICTIGGTCTEGISKMFPNNLSCEYSIGYDGIVPDGHRVFESYAHMHNMYGRYGVRSGEFFDAVIPMPFDHTEFILNEPNPFEEKGDYFVWLGRYIPDKGPDIALEVVKRLGAKLIMAGQGYHGPKEGKHFEHIGHVDTKTRAQLLSAARATFFTTTYLEPFGAVAIESLYCGTPVLCADFGAPAENIVHGRDGYHYRTIGEATYFAERAHFLSRESIKFFARERFDMDVVARKYDAYFHQLLELHNLGFFTDAPPLYLGRYNV